jgi:dTMP kinase
VSELGKRIIIEGTDATGKSTVADALAERFREHGRTVLRIDEPDSAKNEQGATLVPIAAELRKIIKDGSLARSGLTNVLMFSASRRENWMQQSRPALAQGSDVIQARSSRSSEIYQGYVEGVDLELIRYITLLSTDAQYTHPDLEVILDLDDEIERARRLAARGPLETPDTFESRGDDFQQKLLEGYRLLAEKENVPIILVDRPVDSIVDDIWEMSLPLFKSD